MASNPDETPRHPDVEEEFSESLAGARRENSEVVAKYVYDTGDVNGTRQLVAAFLFTPRSRQRAGCLRPRPAEHGRCLHQIRRSFTPMRLLFTANRGSVCGRREGCRKHWF